MYFDFFLHFSCQNIFNHVAIVEKKLPHYRKNGHCGDNTEDNLARKKERDENLIVFADGVKPKFDQVIKDSKEKAHIDEQESYEGDQSFDIFSHYFYYFLFILALEHFLNIKGNSPMAEFTIDISLFRIYCLL